MKLEPAVGLEVGLAQRVQGHHAALWFSSCLGVGPFLTPHQLAPTVGDQTSRADFQGASCRPSSTGFEGLGPTAPRHALRALGRLWGALQKGTHV